MGLACAVWRSLNSLGSMQLCQIAHSLLGGHTHDDHLGVQHGCSGGGQLLLDGHEERSCQDALHNLCAHALVEAQEACKGASR